MITVIIALAFHAIIVLPLILRGIGKVNPIKHFKALTGPLLTAFSTSSSNATLPYTLEAVEKNSGVSNKITSFTLPLGATINMDGTALYEAVAAMFIAQIYGIDLSIGSQIIIFLTATLASIGAAGIPHAGTVTMVFVKAQTGMTIGTRLATQVRAAARSRKTELMKPAARMPPRQQLLRNSIMTRYSLTIVRLMKIMMRQLRDSSI